MKKRYVLKNKRRFYTLIITLSIIASSICFASSVYGSEIRQYKAVTIESGDTLWTIAQRYGKGGDIRRTIFEIKKANKLESSMIYAGDKLLIPGM